MGFLKKSTKPINVTVDVDVVVGAVEVEVRVVGAEEISDVGVKHMYFGHAIAEKTFTAPWHFSSTSS